MVEINNIISEYVHVEETASGIVLSRQFDISQIDFDLLRREFAKTKKKNLVMKDLAELIRSRLDSMLLNNPDRIIYHERYQQIIEDYNSLQDRATIEKTFDELMQIVKRHGSRKNDGMSVRVSPATRSCLFMICCSLRTSLSRIFGKSRLWRLNFCKK